MGDISFGMNRSNALMFLFFKACVRFTLAGVLLGSSVEMASLRVASCSQIGEACMLSMENRTFGTYHSHL